MTVTVRCNKIVYSARPAKSLFINGPAMRFVTAFAAAAACSLSSFAFAAQTIKVAGSSTLKEAVTVWAESYAQAHPDVAIHVSGDGSGTGFRALSMGQAELVSSSRPAFGYELESLKEQNVELEQHVVGRDALSVFVHPGNPLKSASVAQLREIFGEGGTIKKWSELGVNVPGCASGRIELVGRPQGSGTYGDFSAILKAEHGMKLTQVQASSKEVIQAIGADACAIGYGAFLRSDKVRTLCLADDTGKPCATPEDGLAKGAPYPLMRELFLYSPAGAPAPVKQFLAWTATPEAACLM